MARWGIFLSLHHLLFLGKSAKGIIKSVLRKLISFVRIERMEAIYTCRCRAVLIADVLWIQGRLAYKDGSFYEGQWKQGKREGNGTLYYTNGDVFQGFWKDDLKHGKVSSIYQEDLFLKFEDSKSFDFKLRASITNLTHQCDNSCTEVCSL